jgi:hypothetical protein
MLTPTDRIALVTLSGIRLTGARRLNYGGSVGLTTQDSEMLIGSREARGRAVVCLLLMVLLLYNPFFTVLSISQEFSVQHPLSYRATTAGSELRRCTFEAGKPLLPELSAGTSRTSTLITLSHEVALIEPSDTAGVILRTLCDSIWFRPPPSA